MSTISVSIITKNEASCIDRCLKGANLFADEIVLVDNGSTDNTKLIASKYTDKVFDSEIFNSNTHISEFEFGVAKNEAIKKCNCDVIFWMDADDIIDQTNADRIKSLVNNNLQNALYNFTVAYGPLRLEHCRLFPNHKGILFDETHACHEYLNTKGLPIIRRPDVEIQHVPGKRVIPANKRNKMILERDYYYRNRTDKRTIFYLANAYKECGDYDKAIEFYDKYLVHPQSQWAEERLFTRLYKSFCLRNQNKWKKARNELLQSIIEHDGYAESYCDLGDMYFSQQDYKTASAFYQMALTKTIPHDSVLFTAPDRYDAYPKAKIVECLKRERGDVIGNKNSDLNVVVTDSLSDCLIATGVISNYKKYHRDVNVTLFVADELKKELLSNSPEYNVAILKPEDDMNKMVKLCVPGNKKRVDKHDSEWYARSMGYVPNSKELIPNISLDNKMVHEVKNEVTKDYVIVQTMADYQGASWKKEYWDEVVSFLISKGFDVYQVDYKLAQGAKLLGGNAERVKATISLSSFVIGVDGWLHHLSAALDVPTLVLWGSTLPENRGYSFQVNAKVKDLECSPCWNASECRNGIRCLVDLKPKYIIDHIENVLREDYNG